ncbi:carbonic anhydrase 2-like [Neocloeon triangulifer]|uniref:carbonic anhydrase 2-like n=1 Tax=Neocloeon triangulifer TaxID=2078957 RepID=UPI00286F9970|nr:carbonic anhydrase 2-like [Neocloeon triangulifer]
MNSELLHLAFCLAYISTVFADEGHGFGYDGLSGPEFWSKSFQTCAGKYQSPIDIEEHKVTKVSMKPMRYHGFADKPLSSTVSNNGHTVMLQLKTEEPLAVSGGPLHGHYLFQQLHFHWGHNDSVGSEDTINNHSFPMELHMVFYNEKYGDFNNALNHKDGLTVLAFFYEVSSDDNFAYAEMVEHLPTVVLPHSEARLARQLPLELLLPRDKSQYYTYNGSLTTPPCSEVVTWIDYKESIPLSHEQVEEFRSLKNTDGDLLTHNNRPVQPVGDRIVYFNEREDYGDSAAGPISATLPLALLLVIILSMV